MSLVNNVLSVNSGAEKLAKAKKAIGGAAMASIFSLLDFASVPGAFSLKYNTDGEKVEGTNWKSGLKEIGKCAVKCLGYIAVSTAILNIASGAGFILAGLAWAASFGSASVLTDVFDKLLPEEQKLVSEACKAKGIDINSEAQGLDQLT